MNEITNGVSTEQWIEVSRHWKLSAHVPGSSTQSSTEGFSSPSTDEAEVFTKEDFETALRRVSHPVKRGSSLS
jgi:hypothetical protein